MITSKSRRATVATVAVFAAILLAGCGAGSSTSGDGGALTNGRIVALMVDQTCDASAELTSFTPAALSHSVAAAAQGQGTFLGQAITTDAYQDATFKIAHSFTSDRANDAGVRRDLRNQTDAFLSSPDSQTLTKGYRPGTPCGSDLINALTAAQRAFAGMPNSNSRVKDLVYVTNGILIDKKDGTDFVHDRLNTATINRLLAKKKAQGLMPNLKGVSVHYVGLGIADRPISAPQVRAIETFWTTLATRAGAINVESLRSGASLSLDAGSDA